MEILGRLFNEKYLIKELLEYYKVDEQIICATCYFRVTDPVKHCKVKVDELQLLELLTRKFGSPWFLVPEMYNEIVAPQFGFNTNINHLIEDGKLVAISYKIEKQYSKSANTSLNIWGCCSSPMPKMCLNPNDYLSWCNPYKCCSPCPYLCPITCCCVFL